MIKGLSLHVRDRKVLLAGGAVAILLLVIAGLVAATVALRRLDHVIASRGAALGEIGRLRGEAQSLQQQIRQVEARLARAEGSELITLVEGLANRAGGQGSLAFLRPVGATTQDGVQVETLEFKLERLALEPLLRLLWEIENSPAAPLRVAGVRLQRRFDNPALLDATLTVNAYRK